MKELREVYMDYSATTPVKKEVFDEMVPFFCERYGNPSSLYTPGLDAKMAIDKAREQVAALINSDPKEIYFTGCGSESDNWVLHGVVEAYKNKICNQNGNNAFKKISDKCYYRRTFSDSTQNICKSCVAAAHFTDVFLSLCGYLCNDDRGIYASEKIRDYGR